MTASALAISIGRRPSWQLGRRLISTFATENTVEVEGQDKKAIIASTLVMAVRRNRHGRQRARPVPACAA